MGAFCLSLLFSKVLQLKISEIVSSTIATMSQTLLRSDKSSEILLFTIIKLYCTLYNNFIS